MIDYSDWIVIYHNAGTRHPQKVKKFKANCDKCGKDRGYLFKSSYQGLCGSCSQKILQQKIETKHNFYAIRFKKKHEGNIITTRSSYEAAFIDYLVDKNIKFLYEPKRFVFKDGSSYLPDFYLIKDNTYIEIKGLMRDKDVQKIKKFRDEYPKENLLVYTKKELENLGIKLKTFNKHNTIMINGKKWSYSLLRESQFKKKTKDNTTVAYTDLDNNYIYFCETTLDRKTVAHEIYHCMYNDLCLSSANLTDEQIEEVNAEMISRNLIEFINVTNQVYYNLCKLLLERTYTKNYEQIKDALKKEVSTYFEFTENLHKKSKKCKCLFEDKKIKILSKKST